MVILTILVFALLIYAYLAITLQFIAKRTKTPHSWMAWIPILNFVLLANIAQMHWWPILLLIPYVGFNIFLAYFPNFDILIWLILAIMVTLLIYYLTYWEKTFKRLGMSQWWVLALFVPVLNFIILGIAAWSRKGFVL